MGLPRCVLYLHGGMLRYSHRSIQLVAMKFLPLILAVLGGFNGPFSVREYFDDSLRGGDGIRSRFLLVFDYDADLSAKEARTSSPGHLAIYLSCDWCSAKS